MKKIVLVLLSAVCVGLACGANLATVNQTPDGGVSIKPADPNLLAELYKTNLSPLVTAQVQAELKAWKKAEIQKEIARLQAELGAM